MSPPTKKQRTDGGGSGETAGKICSAGQGQAKVATNKKQRNDRTTDTLLKTEWSGLSKRAQSRHSKNELVTRIREMIPGPGKVSENGLMLQAASRIKELELEIESLSNKLETLEKSESSEDNSTDQRVTTVTPAIEQETNGVEALRRILPQPTKASGKRLLEYAWEYMKELQKEINELKHQFAGPEACTEKAKTPSDHGN